jgi:hypothetical protein
MNKDFMGLIREVASRYDVNLKKVEDREKAGIFIDIEDEKVNIAGLDEQEVFNNVFKFDKGLEYRVLDVEKDREFENKKLNILENKQKYSIKYYINSERVA